ncbi:hypothetical protein AGMMS49983_04680 [Clostridia bacterium]|nr:hypothetical protein AGMMS49983_04680 [Clostridia bacterium]
MDLNKMLASKFLTKYRLSKISGVPYTTINDIFSGKTSIERCSAETVYRLAKALDLTIEELMDEPKLPSGSERVLKTRKDFEFFKSAVCHHVKRLGDIKWIAETLQSGLIRDYFAREWYPESLYLLAMTDYLSRENGLPLCSEYNDLRAGRLERPIYPMGMRLMGTLLKDPTWKERCHRECIPEFTRFNIFESEIRNVI